MRRLTLKDSVGDTLRVHVGKNGVQRWVTLTPDNPSGVQSTELIDRREIVKLRNFLNDFLDRPIR